MPNGGGYYWVQCYWCNYWVQDPYIMDHIGYGLCDLCFDWHLGGGQFVSEAVAVRCAGGQWSGGPYEPTAIARTSHLLIRWFPVLQEAVTLNVAEYLCAWHEP